MKLSEVERTPAPARIVVLQPSAFADTWPKKPTVEVAIGLRLLSQAEIDVARRNAEREAVGFYEELHGRPRPADPETVGDVYNDAFCMNAVARATCDPNDMALPYWPYADDQVRQALTPEGARQIWDEIVILHKGSSGGRQVATDEEVRHLGSLLASGGVRLDVEGRKLVAYLLEKLEGESEGAAVEDDDDDEAEVTYTAKAG